MATSSLNTASYTVHPCPLLSSSFLPSLTLMGKRRCSTPSFDPSSIDTSAFCTSSGTASPLPHFVPGAAILAWPQTLTKTLRPASSTVLMTNIASG